MDVKLRTTFVQAAMLGLLTLQEWPIALLVLTVLIKQQSMLCMVTGRAWAPI